VNGTTVVSRTATEKEVVDAAAMRKAMDEAASTERAVVDKKATDVAMVKKVVDDAVAAERAAADNGAVTERDAAAAERATVTSHVIKTLNPFH
jgi:hypothetical protein